LQTLTVKFEVWELVLLDMEDVWLEVVDDKGGPEGVELLLAPLEVDTTAPAELTAVGNGELVRTYLP